MQDNCSEERDINEAFSDIALVENKAFKEGYREGLLDGKDQKDPETFTLGLNRGILLGTEIGYYNGVTRTYLAIYEEKVEADTERIVKELTGLKKMLEDFPRRNDPEVDFEKLLGDLRAKFRKVCAILKIRADYPTSSKLSF